MSSESLGTRAIRGAGATLFWQSIRIGLLALSIIVLARLLSPSDYGLVAMVTAIVGIGELIRDMGLSLASVQAASVSQAEKSNLFWANTFIGISLTVITFLLSWPLAALYGEPKLVEITQLVSLTFLFNGVATQFKAEINRNLRFMTLGLVEALPQALALALAVAVAIIWGDYRALVVQSLATAVLAFLLDVALARWRPGRLRRDVSIRRFVRFGAALAGTQGLAYVSKNVDTVALGLVYGSSSLGYYTRAYQIVVLPISQLTAPISRVAIPILSRVSDDKKRFAAYLKTGQFFSVALSGFLYGSLFGLANPLVLGVLGEKWLPVVPILQALSISGIFRVMGQVPYWIFVSKGLTGKQLQIYLIAQPIVILAILIGVPWGGLGVAIGGSIGYAIFWISQMLWAGKRAQISVRTFIVSGLVLAIVTAAPAAILGWAATRLIPGIVPSIVIGAAVISLYTALLIAIVPTYRRHLMLAIRIARNRSARPAP